MKKHYLYSLIVVILAFLIPINTNGQSCLTNSLNISTGFDPVTGTYITPGADGATPVPDPKWVISYVSPDMTAAIMSTTTPTGVIGVTAGNNADVITRGYTWTLLGNWISCANVVNIYDDGTGTCTTGPQMYATFARPFILCNTDNVTFNLQIADDNYISSIEVDGTPLPFTEPCVLPVSGSYTTYTPFSSGLTLPAGLHTLKVKVHNTNWPTPVFNGFGLNIDGNITSSLNSIISESTTCGGAWCSSTVCSGGTTAIVGPAGGTWSSSNTGIATVAGTASGIVTGVSPGTVTITNTYSGTSAIYTMTVEVTVAAITGAGAICPGGTIALSNTVSGGIWTTATPSIATVDIGTGVVTGVSGGSAVISYTNSCGSVTTTVTVNPLPASISGPSLVCMGTSITLSDATAGGVWASANLTGTASVGSTTGIVTGLSTGKVEIAYILPTGCMITTTLDVDPEPITGPSAVCMGSTIALSNGTAGGIWMTGGGTGSATIGSATGIVTGVSAGTVVIDYVSPAGCYVTATINVNPTPASITGPTFVCMGLTAPMSSTTPGGIWSCGTSTLSIIGSTSGIVTGGSLSGSEVITYTVGTCMVTKTITVESVPPPITGPTSVCIGSTIILSDAYIFGTWSSSNPGIATIGSTSRIVTGITAGTTIITFTFATGCIATTSVTVISTPPPISGATTVCESATITLSDAMTGGIWTSANTGVATAGSVTGMVTGVSSGTSVISYTTTCGLVTTTVTVIPLYVPITGPSSVCEGSTIALSDALAGGTWSSSNPATGSISVAGVVGGIAAGTTVISYTTTCGSVITTTITVSPLPSPITGAVPVCVGSTITLSDATAGGAWSSGTPSVATVTSVTGLVTGLTAGTTVITYMAGSGCVATETVTVLPPPTPILGPTTMCQGTTLTLSNATTGGLWSSGFPATATIGPASGLVTGISGGGTYIYYTLPTGCFSSIIMTVYPLPAAITGSTAICSGSTSALSNSTSGGTWSSATPGVASIGSLSGVATGGSTGTAVITYKLPTGCYVTTTVTVSTLPTAIIGLSSVCVGSTITLSNATTGGTWSGGSGVAGVGASTGIVTGLSTGSTVITYSLAGCIKTHTVTVHPISAISGPHSVCEGLTITLGDATPGGVWSSASPGVADIGSASGIVTGLSGGTSTITYSMGTGCMALYSFTVLPAPPITGSLTICEEYGDMLYNSLPGGIWTSSNPAIGTIDPTTGDIGGGTAGVTIITYSFLNGCIATRTLSVIPRPSYIIGTTHVCEDDNVVLSDFTPGGTWSSLDPTIVTVGPISGIVTGIVPGWTVIAYTLPNGCQAWKSMSVSPLPAVIAGTTTVCVGSYVTLSDATIGGYWTSDDPTIADVHLSLGIVTGMSAGAVLISYMVFPSGCVRTTTVTVDPLPDLISGPSTVCAGLTITLTNSVPGGTWSSGGGSGTASIGSATGIVTGGTAGTVVITYTTICGYVTTTITVNPLPPAIAGSSIACVGASITLSDAVTGGLWTSDAPGIASIVSGTGVVTGVSPGVANITYMLPTGCIATKSITVNPMPGVIAGPNVVCAGSSITLTNGVSGGIWSTGGGTGTAIIGTATGIVTGVTAGSVVVSYTTVCASVTKTITVNPVPAAITGVNSLCMGTTATILSDATSGGTWSSSNGTIATIGSTSRAIFGVSAGTVIISYKLVSTGCAATKSVTVYGTGVCPCSMGTTPFTTLTSGTIGGSLGTGRYYVPNNTLIADPGSTITFSNTQLIMDAGVQLDVDWSTELILTGAHLYGCSTMWQGLVLQPEPATPSTISARILVTGGTLIEDAITAIYAQDPVNTGVGNIVETDDAIFNRNNTGIEINNYPWLEATYPFAFKNTVFTSRSFSSYTSGASTYPNVWPSTTASPKGLKYAWSPGTSYEPPFNIDNPSMGYSGAACKNGGAQEVGIKLTGVGTYSGTPTFYSEVQIGDDGSSESNANLNMFDRLTYGVYAENTNFTCVNNVFMHVRPVIEYNGTRGGVCVYAKVTDDYNNHNRMRVYKASGSSYINSFYDFYYGVTSYNYFNVMGDSCMMICKDKGTAFLRTAAFGFVVKSMHYESIDLNLNTITNVANGIAVWSTYDPMIPSMMWPYRYKGRMNILGNTLQAGLSGYTGSGMAQYMKTGISVQNPIAYLALPIGSGMFMDPVHVDYNNIYESENGIYVNGYYDQTVFSNMNNIRMRKSVMNRLQYGINHTGNMRSSVFANNVTASDVTIMSDSARAYYAAKNLGLNMGCNDEDHIGRGYEFVLNNLGTQWHDNTIEANYKGMVLNAARIGPQRYMGYPMNNLWPDPSGTWWSSTRPQTYVYNRSKASASEFYVNNSVYLNPSFNEGPTSVWNYDATSIHTISATYTSSICPSGPVGYHGNPEAMIMLEDVAQDHVAYPYAVVPHRWIAQYELWRAILMDSSMTDSSAAIAQFASMAAISRYAYLADIEHDLAMGDYTNATIKLGYDIDSMANTSFDSATAVEITDGTGANYIVQNYQQLYGLYIKYMNSSLTTSDSLAIMGLAQLCPELNGSVVYQARALYSDIYRDLNMFNDDSCLDVDTTYVPDRRSNPYPNPGVININATQQSYAMYPNPNDGNFELKQMVADKESVTAEVFDMIGRKVGKEKVQFNTPTAKVYVGNVSPGMYILQLTDNKKRIFKFKFTIEK